MAEPRRFTLPDVGEGLTEAEIVTWHVKAGDTVAVNDLLVEVETAKSLVELPSPEAGVIARLHAAEGDTVPVGAVIVSFGSDTNDPDDDPDDPPAPPSPGVQAPEAPAVEEERQSVLVGYGPSRATVARRPRKPGAAAELPAEPVPAGGRPHATPPVRLRARELGVDLVTVRPTGAHGRITRGDVEAAARVAPGETTATTATTETRTAIKGVRKATAEAMVSSAFTAPHVTEWVTVDVTDSLALLDQLRAERGFAGVRLTPLLLVLRATLSALRAHPEMNAKWDAAAGEIVQYGDVNLGIAAATPRGLLVPNIKAAQRLSTRELADALGELVAEAREGKTPPARMAKGTFTITNIGVFGVDGGTPILNPGEAGILCVGRIVRRPWEHRGEIALRSVCTLSLSFDHRLVDGKLGSEVLAHIGRLLSQPSLALIG